jgi:hypothetical protein
MFDILSQFYGNGNDCMQKFLYTTMVLVHCVLWTEHYFVPFCDTTINCTSNQFLIDILPILLRYFKIDIIHSNHKYCRLNNFTEESESSIINTLLISSFKTSLFIHRSSTGFWCPLQPAAGIIDHNIYALPHLSCFLWLHSCYKEVGSRISLLFES